MYYKVIQTKEEPSDYEIVECSHNEYGFSHTKESAMIRYEENLKERIDSLIDQIVDERLELKAFLDWKNSNEY